MTPGRAGLVFFAIALLVLPSWAQETGKKYYSPTDTTIEKFDVFKSPIASPAEPGSLLRFAGNSWIDFGLAFPLSLYSAENQESSLEVGMRPGMLSRLEIMGNQLGLKSADFRLGFLFSYRNGNWAARTELFHVSSHRGADLVETTSPSPFSYSRESIQTLVAYGRAGHWRVYAGPTIVQRTNPSLGRWTIQAGMEWFPASFSHARVRPYLAGDFQRRQEVDWNSSISMEPGILFSSSDGQPIARLGLWLYRGQTPFGQFYRETDKQVGIQLTMELRPSKKSLLGRRK